MKKQFLVLSDLDHTLFQSHASDPTGYKPMAVDANGKNSGFANEHQVHILDQAQRDGTLIAVTARCHSKFERVKGLRSGEVFDLALTDLGATLLIRDNRPEAQSDDWVVVDGWGGQYIDKIVSHSELVARDYESTMNHIKSVYGSDCGIHGEMTEYGKTGIPFYAGFTIDKNSGVKIQDFLDMFIRKLVGAPYIYTLYVKDNVVCLWPRFVSKGSAVLRLLDIIDNNPDSLGIDFDLSELANRTIITMGDMTHDHEFMRHGHLMVISTKSNLGRFTEDCIGSV